MRNFLVGFVSDTVTSIPARRFVVVSGQDEAAVRWTFPSAYPSAVIVSIALHADTDYYGA